MSEFMQRFLQKTLACKAGIHEFAIQLLAQAVGRNQSSGSAKLRFAEYEGKDRDKQVHAGDAEDAVAIIREGCETTKDCGRMILAADGIESELRVDRIGSDVTGNAQLASKPRGQGIQDL
jgi:hypothetical protein